MTLGMCDYSCYAKLDEGLPSTVIVIVNQDSQVGNTPVGVGVGVGVGLSQAPNIQTKDRHSS